MPFAILIFILSVTLPAPALGLSHPLFDGSQSAGADQGILPRLPAFGLFRAETIAVSVESRSLAALALLSRTETGRSLSALVSGGGVRIVLDEQGLILYQDCDHTVHLARDFLRMTPLWQIAVILSHELEHANQDRLGLTGEDARGIRESAAFVVQCRVWVELGGKVDEKDWALNLMNSQDMWAWMDHPWSSVAAIAVRAEHRAASSRRDVNEYWSKTLGEEARWRRDWSTRFPAGRADKGAALFILNQAARVRSAGPVSPWLPEVLQRAALLEPGQEMRLNGRPTASDLAAFASLGLRVIRSPSARWALLIRP